MFQLHPALQEKTFICDLPLCRVLLEDNRVYPWIFLVPRKEGVKNMLNLTSQERQTLMQEIELCEEVMYRLFQPNQTNVAAIGNITPQLHVHIICRFVGDPAWPGVVWGTKGTPCSPAEKEKRLMLIKKEIEKCQK